MDERTQQTPPEVPDLELIRPVGRGGFGEVWLAANRTTGRLCAVKLIPLEQSGRMSPAAREIGSLTRLEANRRCRHPNLLPIDHVGKTATHLFYVMEPADDAAGGPASRSPNYRPATLETQLQSGCPEPDVCLRYAQQLLEGLASLHAAGMVHRDVKPANCLLVGGQLKLADFGLLTESHPLVSQLGTRKYMPPDGRMDRRADVYAAGLVIYEMLTGLPVNEFPRLGHRAGQIAESPILAALLRLALHACEREPDERFSDAREMLAELTTADMTTAPPRRRRLRATAAVCFGFAVAATIMWSLLPRHVNVNFVTFPYEAKIYVDETLLSRPDGSVYLTPCTVDGLSADEHRVAFQCEGLSRWDAGRYDLRTPSRLSAAGRSDRL